MTHSIIGLLLFVGGNSVVSWSARYVSTGLGGAITATVPFWMLLLSSLLPPKETIQPKSLVGLLIGFVGMLVLLSPELLKPQAVTPAFWPSILFLLAMAFFWAAGSIYARIHQTPSTSMLMGVGLQNMAAALFLLPITFLTVDWKAIHPTTASLSALFYLVFAGSLLALPCYYYVLRHLSVAMASTFAYVTPVLTLIFGWLFLGESLSAPVIWGMGIILGGVFLVQGASQGPNTPAPVRASARLETQPNASLVDDSVSCSMTR
jgi:drug/metabolite transporter (DMT)-like permease